jgi:enamine deaminase RidA (YjgF/YER057c/UK114 family)
VSIERINPPGVVSTGGSYTHVVRSSGARTVYISGQVGLDAAGRSAGDFAAQARQVFANLHTCLAAVGATTAQVVKMTTYIVGYQVDVHRPALTAARFEAFGLHPPASTLVGVQALAVPELLIEVEAIAVLD